MKTITFRSLQRMTVKELEEIVPVEITVDGEVKFWLGGVNEDKGITEGIYEGMDGKEEGGGG